MSFSDFAVFADESGSPHLEADKDDFPIFVLALLIVRKDVYCDRLVPAVQRLKFDFVGHDQIVLHERDIRRQAGAFSFLQVSAEQRARFLERINGVVRDAEVSIVAAIIDKRELWKRHADRWSPYDLALTFCLGRTARFLRDEGEDGRAVHVVFEARGPTEDRQLELSFHRIVGGQPTVGKASGHLARFHWTPMFVSKKSNAAGIQVADLAARPIGLGFLRPNQVNRALEALKPKLVPPGPQVFPR